MKDPGIGKLITSEQSRDAIHIAVAPVEAAHEMEPGQHIGLMEDGRASSFAGKTLIGIVDPFVKETVNAGEKFWMFLYPQTITSLRHEWTHPSFEAVEKQSGLISQKQKAEEYLRHFAEEVGIGYKKLMEAAQYCNESTGTDWDGSIHLNYDTPDIVYKEKERMWDAFAIVTGTTVKDKKAGFISCSC